MVAFDPIHPLLAMPVYSMSTSLRHIKHTHVQMKHMPENIHRYSYWDVPEGLSCAPFSAFGSLIPLWTTSVHKTSHVECIVSLPGCLIM